MTNIDEGDGVDGDLQNARAVLGILHAYREDLGKALQCAGLPFIIGAVQERLEAHDRLIKWFEGIAEQFVRGSFSSAGLPS